MDGRNDGIVFAKSQKEAVEKIGTTMHDFREYWDKLDEDEIPKECANRDLIYSKKICSSETWKPWKN